MVRKMDIILFGYKMDFLLFLTIIGLIGSIIWNSYNTYQNMKQNKKYETIILRLPFKKRLFNELYDLTKDLTKRMEVTETIDQKNYKVYKFHIREKNGVDYLSQNKQINFIQKIGLLKRDISKVCCYEGSGVKINKFELAKFKSTINKFEITYPNDDDDLPKGFEEIKKVLLEEIILMAKENGVKIKGS